MSFDSESRVPGPIVEDRDRLECRMRQDASTDALPGLRGPDTLANMMRNADFDHQIRVVLDRITGPHPKRDPKKSYEL